MILSHKQIEEIAAAVTKDFNVFFFGQEPEDVRIPRATPIDQFAKDYLGLNVSFARLSDDGSICGLTAYADTEYIAETRGIRRTIPLKQSGRITAERFDMLASEYEQEQKELKVKITKLDDLIENGETQTKDLKQLLVNVRKYTDPQELTAQMVNDLVDKIVVYAPDKSSGHRRQKIEIYYNAVGIIDLPTVQEDDCIALHGRCKGKKIAV